MDANFIARNWALIAAAGVLLPVAFLIVVQLIGSSATGQLRNTRAELADEKRKLAKAMSATRKAEARVDKMLQQADKVKPRLLQEAKETLQDARALAKIATDRVLIAGNHVRRVIHEEFPPVKHARLRKKCLPEPAPEHRPFSF